MGLVEKSFVTEVNRLGIAFGFFSTDVTGSSKLEALTELTSELIETAGVSKPTT